MVATNKKTSEETHRTPDGTESVRLALGGANYRATTQEIADLATVVVPSTDLLGGDGSTFTEISVGSGLDLTGGVLTATGGSTYTGPLDIVPGAVGAYGNRALSSVMRGQPLYRLRRDSDDAEQTFNSDVTTGEALVADIVAWLGGANGFVKTWFDQSGNGADVTQTVIVNQPGWSASGPNGKPTVVFPDTQSTVLSTAGNVVINQDFLSFNVISFASDGGANGSPAWGMNADASSPGYVTGLKGRTRLISDFYDDTSGNEAGSTTTAGSLVFNQFIVVDNLNKFGANDFYINGAIQTLSGNFDSGDDPGSLSLPLAVGSDDPGLGSGGMTGEITELIIYSPNEMGNPDRLAIRQNIAAYYNIILSPIVTGAGTTNTIPKWTGTAKLGDSSITDDGTIVTIGPLIAQLNPTNGSKTSNYLVLTDDNTTYFDNTGAMAEVDFTLPDAALGLEYTFTVTETRIEKVIAGALTVIYLGSQVTAAAGNLSSNTPGSSVTLEAKSATSWIAKSFTGTWDVN